MRSGFAGGPVLGKNRPLTPGSGPNGGVHLLAAPFPDIDSQLSSRETRPLTTLLSAQPWRSRASCIGLDPTLFYPADDDGAATDAAKTICEACDVHQQCLEYALAAREKDGVWGGHTALERRRIIRRRRRSA